MFLTEFVDTNYNLVISWKRENSDKSQIDIENDIRCDENTFNRLDELFKTICKSCSEYVEYLNSVHGTSDFNQLQKRLRKSNPKVTFTTKPSPNDYRLKISSLGKRIDQLIKEKEELVAKHENQLLKEKNDFDQRIRDIIKLNHERLNSVKQELEDKYRFELENKTPSFRSLAEQNAQCNTSNSTRRQSNIENDQGNEFTKATTSCIINPKINSILEHNEKEMNKRDQEYENHVESSPICVEIEGDYSSWEEVSKKQKQVTGESLSSNYRIERVLSELPRSQADLDSFVFPFPIEHDELFRDYFWTSERRKDMSLVNKLIQNFINYKSLKTKLLSEGLFTMYTEYRKRNVFPCWEIPCLLRNKRFPTARHRDAHIIKYHSTGRTIFICNTCHWPESSQEGLNEHETTSRCRKRKR